MSDYIADIRREYMSAGLHESELAPDPIAQFRAWFEEAAQTEIHDVNAMTLATASPDGRPSARIVLLKGLDEGFIFYTNYDSHKGRELAANPHAALVFWWPTLSRQVRIEGTVERTSAEESDAYFVSRPRRSCIGAIASPQSCVIDNREILEQRALEVEGRFGADMVIPRPEHWGGYRVRPTLVEFWQGRENRLHDRLQYRKDGDGWVVERLGP